MLPSSKNSAAPFTIKLPVHQELLYFFDPKGPATLNEDGRRMEFVPFVNAQETVEKLMNFLKDLRYSPASSSMIWKSPPEAITTDKDMLHHYRFRWHEKMNQLRKIASAELETETIHNFLCEEKYIIQIVGPRIPPNSYYGASIINIFMLCITTLAGYQSDMEQLWPKDLLRCCKGKQGECKEGSLECLFSSLPEDDALPIWMDDLGEEEGCPLRSSISEGDQPIIKKLLYLMLKTVNPENGRFHESVHSRGTPLLSYFWHPFGIYLLERAGFRLDPEEMPFLKEGFEELDHIHPTALAFYTRAHELRLFASPESQFQSFIPADWDKLNVERRRMATFFGQGNLLNRRFLDSPWGDILPERDLAVRLGDYKWDVPRPIPEQLISCLLATQSEFREHARSLVIMDLDYCIPEESDRNANAAIMHKILGCRSSPHIPSKDDCWRARKTGHLLLDYFSRMQMQACRLRFLEKRKGFLKEMFRFHEFPTKTVTKRFYESSYVEDVRHFLQSANYPVLQIFLCEVAMASSTMNDPLLIEWFLENLSEDITEREWIRKYIYHAARELSPPPTQKSQKEDWCIKRIEEFRRSGRLEEEDDDDDKQEDVPFDWETPKKPTNRDIPQAPRRRNSRRLSSSPSSPIPTTPISRRRIRRRLQDDF